MVSSEFFKSEAISWLYFVIRSHIFWDFIKATLNFCCFLFWIFFSCIYGIFYDYISIVCYKSYSCCEFHHGETRGLLVKTDAQVLYRH